MASKVSRVFRPVRWWVASFGGQFTQRTRAIYVVGGTAVVALALFAFSIVDLIEGRMSEAARSFTVVVILLTVAAVFPSRSNPNLMARVSLALSLLVISYETAVGANEGFTFLWFYVLPLGLFFVLGRREGLVWLVATATILGWLLFVVDHQTTADGDVGTIALATFSLLGILGYGLESARHRLAEMLKQERAELESVLLDLEALYGLVPICSSCKNVRDDGGYWYGIETYLSKHSAVELQAAFCPSCLQDSSLGDSISDREGRSTEPVITARANPASLPDEHDRRRRIYFSAGMGILIPFMCYFGSIDFRAGRMFEAGLVYGLAAVFGLSLWALRSGKLDRWVYQVAAGTSLAVLAYELHVGAYGGFVALWIYSFPAFAIFVLGTRGLFWSLVGLAMSSFYLLGPIGQAYPISMSSRFLTTLSLVIMMAYGLEVTRRRSHDRWAKESDALRESLEQVRTLRGLLPMCPSCKNVRDDRGFWEQIEIHVTRVSGTRFTHGLCPSCASKAFGELGLDEHETGRVGG